jgi:hypothetical protein
MTRLHKNTENKPTRFYSSKQEKYVAKEIGGKTTANSGATPFQKGDIVHEQFLIECKTKTSPSSSISIKKEWLDKLKEEARFMGKEFSTLIFNFEPNGENYAILPLQTFNIFLELLKEAQDG